MTEYFVYGYTFDGEKKLLGNFKYELSAVEEATTYSHNMGYTTTFVTGPKGFYKTFVNTALKK